MPFLVPGGGDYQIVGTNIKGGTNAAPAVIGDNNMALGNGALQNIQNGDVNIAIGNTALSNLVDTNGNVVIGVTSGAGIVTTYQNIIVGYASDINENNYEGEGLQNNAIVIGANSNIGAHNIAIGSNITTQEMEDAGDTPNTILIGHDLSLPIIGHNFIAGSDISRSGGYSFANVVIGDSINIESDYSVAIGNNIYMGGQNSVALGLNATVADSASGFAVTGTVNSSGSVAILGTAGGTIFNSGYNIAIGDNSSATANDSVAIGRQASASANYSVAIGYGVSANSVKGIRIGDPTSTDAQIGSYDLSTFVTAGGLGTMSTQDAEAVDITGGSVDVDSLTVSGKTVPYVVEQWAVASGVAPSGVVGNNGALTLGTALPRTYSAGIYLYFPADAIYAGSAAGSYWCVMSSTTAGTIYQETLSGIPSYVAAPTSWVTTGPGAFVGSTAEISLASYSLAGNSLGNNGGYSSVQGWSTSNSASNKEIRIKYGGGNIYQITTITTSQSASHMAQFRNRGVSGEQICGSALAAAGGLGTSSANIGSLSVNSSTNQTVLYTGKTSLATDYVILEYAECSIAYKA